MKFKFVSFLFDLKIQWKILLIKFRKRKIKSGILYIYKRVLYDLKLLTLWVWIE